MASLSNSWSIFELLEVLLFGLAWARNIKRVLLESIIDQPPTSQVVTLGSFFRGLDI